MSVLDVLNAQRAGLKKQLAEVEAAIREQELEKAKEKHDVYIGCIVEDGAGTRFEVSQIDTSFRHKPWIYGHKIKKDGTPSKSSQNIYGDWKVIK